MTEKGPPTGQPSFARLGSFSTQCFCCFGLQRRFGNPARS